MTENGHGSRRDIPLRWYATERAVLRIRVRVAAGSVGPC